MKRLKERDLDRIADIFEDYCGRALAEMLALRWFKLNAVDREDRLQAYRETLQRLEPSLRLFLSDNEMKEIEEKITNFINEEI